MGLMALIMFAHIYIIVCQVNSYLLLKAAYTVNSYCECLREVSYRDAVASCNSDFWSVMDSNSWQRYI